MNIVKLITITATFAIVACGDAPAPTDAPAPPPAPVATTAPATPAADTAVAPMADTAAAPMADTAMAPMTDTAAAPSVDTAAMATAAPAEMVGIATCDDYLKQYEACVTSANPAAQAAMKTGLDQMRGQWLLLAKDAQQKAGLEMACKAAMDQFPTLKTTYGCK